MSRPLKSGVDSFFMDTGFYTDDKVRLLRAEFGAKGMYLLNYLLCEIYGKEGYFMKWDREKCFLVSDGAGCGLGPDFTDEFIRGCVRCSFFDERVFNMFGILTSSGIQRRFVRALKCREKFTFFKEYFLLDLSDENDVPPGILNKLAFKLVSDKENRVSNQENPVILSDKTQKKRKETKRNEKKESTGKSPGPVPYEKIVELYNSLCISFPKVTVLSEARKRAIKQRLKTYTYEQFIEVFKLAEESDFLKGKNDRKWRANFDWIMNDSNFAKIKDRNYNDSSAGETEKKDYGDLEELTRRRI